MTLLQVSSNWYQNCRPIPALSGGDSGQGKGKQLEYDIQKAKAWVQSTFHGIGDCRLQQLKIFQAAQLV